MPEERDEQMCGEMTAEDAVEKFMGLIVNTAKKIYRNYKYPSPPISTQEMEHGANIQNRVPWIARTENVRMKCDFDDVRQLVSISFIEDICKRYDPTRGAHFAFFAKSYLEGSAERHVRRECLGLKDTDLAEYREYKKNLYGPEIESDSEELDRKFCLINMCLDMCDFTEREEEVLNLIYDNDFVSENGRPRQQNEVAEILDRSDGAISQGMKRARAKLKKCLVEIDEKGVC